MVMCWWLTVDTASGDRTAALATAWYGWPDTEELTVEVIRAGRPLIAVGLLPHSNEPLGSAFAAVVRTRPPASGPGLALVGPIDPPPAAHRFRLPADPLTFLGQGYLAPLSDQVEFAHVAHPATPAQRRAEQLRLALSDLAPDAYLMLHNDVGARAPYLYANRVWPEAEQRLDRVVARYYNDQPPDDMSWTEQIGRRTYAFFSCAQLGVVGSASAGLYLEQVLGLPTMTLELPVFDWGPAEAARAEVLDAIEEWIEAGASNGGDTGALVSLAARALAGASVSMVSAAASAHTVFEVIDGIGEGLTTSAMQR
jgi:hypothetical protein